MIRLAFVTSGLGTGGAETALYRILLRLDRTRFAAAVFSLGDDGVFGKLLRTADIPVYTACLGRAGKRLSGLLKLRHAIAEFNPHILQGWMYHGNLAAMLLNYSLAGKRSMSWGIRQSLYDLRREKAATATVIRLCAKLSPLTSSIVYNSFAGMAHHEAIGFRCKRSMTIPNGFDTSVFIPCEEARNAVRQELGLSRQALLIGLFARFHPVKDHRCFLEAAAKVAVSVPAATFLLAGTEVDPENSALAALIRSSGIGNRIVLLGERDDVSRLTAALDIAVCASQAEGFPNVVGEAMSCAVPCAVTDVGDCAALVQNTGVVAKPCDPVALAAAMTQLALLSHEERKVLGMAARKRIVECFSIDSVARSYENLYGKLARVEPTCAA